jgi:hypothetical protein
MLDDLGIKGIRPIDDRPSKNGNPKKQGTHKRFTLEGENEEKDKEKNQKKQPRQSNPEKQDKPTRSPKEGGGIDILV